MSANDRQVGGDHYKKYETEDGLQHWDLAAAFSLDYFQGVITKYVFRWRDKDGIAALRKAAHYLEKYIECEENGYDIATVRAIIEALDAMYREPVPMLLFCPKCHAQHVDKPDISINWSNPPHRSHKCMINGCGYTWRPADVPTVGVREIKTVGKNDDDPIDGWFGKHRTTPLFSLEGFKETYALYRCTHAECREHFHVPMRMTPQEVHDCPYRNSQLNLPATSRYDMTNPSHGLPEDIEKNLVRMESDGMGGLKREEPVRATLDPRVFLSNAERLGILDNDAEPGAAYVDQAHDRPHVTRAGERRLATLQGIVDMRVTIRRACDAPHTTFDTPVGG